MKLKIEINESLCEDEIIIRCREATEEILRLQKMLDEAVFAPQIIFYKNDEEFYFPISEVLFFETENDCVYAHTAESVYRVKKRLYELEELLPASFVRVSKSAILNINRVLSINKNLASASLVRFKNTHKQIYVSRSYYKQLKERLRRF